MLKKARMLLIGMILGAAIAVAIGWHILPGMLIQTETSGLTFDETVRQIESQALKRGWMVPKIYDMQYSLQTAGHPEMTRMKVLSLCQPDQAYKILDDDQNKKVASMMPCRIGVFEAADGNVYISRMNLALMSRMFGGTIEDVMTRVDTEEELILVDIIEK